MIGDMAARKLNPHTQRSHVCSRMRFAAWLKRSPDTATPSQVRHFAGSGSASISHKLSILPSAEPELCEEAFEGISLLDRLNYQFGRS